MTQTSSSIHRLNGDRKLSRFRQGLYFVLNWINNQFPYSWLDPKLTISDFICADFKTHWNRLIPKSSPSRRLCDLFWLKLPWSKIKDELHEIRILDLGCGDGHYGNRLADYSQGRIASYTGIDARQSEHWASLKRSNSLLSFYQITSNEISPHIPLGTNFFISQSAIEHLDDDLFYFEQIKKHLLSHQKSAIQVHLFPSSACLGLYGLHGVRQYTPRTISKISCLFKDFSDSILYRLGGKSCNRLHYRFITEPLFFRKEDWRETKTAVYEGSLQRAIEQDMQQPQSSPSFYALIIYSFKKERFNSPKPFGG